MIVSAKFELAMLIAAAGEHAAGEHRRAEALAGALGFAASFAAADDFAGLRVHQAIVEHDHGFGIRLGSADDAARAADDRATRAADLAVVAAENDDVAHQREIRAANLADARAGALLHAIAGGEILLLQ